MITILETKEVGEKNGLQRKIRVSFVCLIIRYCYILGLFKPMIPKLIFLYKVVEFNLLTDPFELSFNSSSGTGPPYHNFNSEINSCLSAYNA